MREVAGSTTGLDFYLLCEPICVSVRLFHSTLSDINECDDSNGMCQHVCEDDGGSYTCKCNAGFTLAADQHSCVGKWQHENVFFSHLLLSPECRHLLMPFLSYLRRDHHCIFMRVGVN
jgi:hypothetical protein